jgi:hypothetical protein
MSVTRAYNVNHTGLDFRRSRWWVFFGIKKIFKLLKNSLTLMKECIEKFPPSMTSQFYHSFLSDEAGDGEL